MTIQHDPKAPAVMRAEIVDHLEEAFADAPVQRDDLLDAVLTAGARPQVIEVLRRLPERHRFTIPGTYGSTRRRCPLSTEVTRLFPRRVLDLEAQRQWTDARVQDRLGAGSLRPCPGAICGC